MATRWRISLRSMRPMPRRRANASARTSFSPRRPTEGGLDAIRNILRRGRWICAPRARLGDRRLHGRPTSWTPFCFPRSGRGGDLPPRAGLSQCTRVPAGMIAGAPARETQGHPFRRDLHRARAWSEPVLLRPRLLRSSRPPKARPPAPRTCRHFAPGLHAGRAARLPQTPSE